MYNPYHSGRIACAVAVQHKPADWRYSVFRMLCASVLFTGYILKNTGISMIETKRHAAGQLGFILCCFFLCATINASQAVNKNVQEAQTQLAELGYHPGIADGLFGEKTREALMEYQKDNNLPITGNIDKATAKALGVETYIPTYRDRTGSPSGQHISGTPEKNYSISAQLSWADGSTEEVVVMNWNSKEKFSSLDRGIYIGEAGDGRRFPWEEIKQIDILQQGKHGDKLALIESVDGNTIKAVVPGPSIEAYWHGMAVDAVNWVKASSFSRGAYTTPPKWGSSSCDGAGGCRNTPLSWGNWKFVSKKGDSLEGIITGGFGVDRPGGTTQDGDYIPVGKITNFIFFPSGGNGAMLHDGKFEIDMSPGFNIKRFEFDLDDRFSPAIKLKFSNDKNGVFTTDPGEPDDLYDLYQSGFVAWTFFGPYQARTVVRIKDLDYMELLEDENIDLIANVSKIIRPERKWKVLKKNGDVISANVIKGYQRQQVPVDPPKGKYWMVRPPQKPGIAGGEYVISPHASGFHIIPINIISEIDPGTSTIRLRDDAGGQELNMSRFHPGNSWVYQGISGRTYIDDDADRKIPLKKSGYVSTGDSKNDEIPLSEISIILQE